MKRLRSLGLAVAYVFMIAMLGIRCAIKGSPTPFIHWFRKLPDPGPSAPRDFMDYARLVEVHRDLVYPSKFGSNTLDIYRPKGAATSWPTILWVHGGGFIAGDKSGTAYWCTMMASKGYTVVSMNYETAPEAHYPAPVIQLAEVYEYLSKAGNDAPTPDLSRLVIGGDSAGAQIASQFIAIQTNAVLSGLTGIPQTVPIQSLKGALLFCGPYNVKRLANAKGWLEKFFLNHLGWAYMGVRNWKDDPRTSHASTVNYVTKDYPPTFITDGNTGSFETHAKELEEKLTSLHVPVTSLYYPLHHGVVHHEYQFKLDTAEAMECFHKTLSFLDHCLQTKEMTTAQNIPDGF